MFVGMYFTIKSLGHQKHGDECHVNKTNSVLGLGMYFSYFVLFFKLFVDNYCLKRKDAPQLSRKPSASLGTERKESSSLLPRKASVSLDAVRKASEKALYTVRKASERTLDDLVPNLDGDDTEWKAHKTD